MNENKANSPAESGKIAESREEQAPAPAVCPFAPRPVSTAAKIARMVVLVVLLISLLINVYLLLAIAMIDTSDMNKTLLREGEKDQVVAIYKIDGIISDDSMAAFEQFFREIKDDHSIKAVVLRVDSPGGTVSASNQMHHMIEKIRKSGKTLVVSMGGLAASGGYMVSAPADTIYAEPSTLTGSIGVIAQVPNVHGTLDKIGVKMITIKSSHSADWKDSLSPFKKEISQREIDDMTELLDKMQVRFENIVIDGRGSKLKTATTAPAGTKGKEPPVAAFNGKVFMADEALDLGLVDKIGYLEDAVDEAARLASLSKPNVIRYSPSAGLLDIILDMGLKSREAPAGIDADILDRIQTPRILMIWKVE